MTDATETGAKLAIAHASTSAAAGDKTGAYAVVPDGFRLNSLEEFQDRPNRTKANPTFRDTKSLAVYVDIYRQPQSLVFSAPGRRKIEVGLDYHGAETPSHCDHHATFAAIFTAEYEAWRNLGGKWMAQKTAGEFLEERAVDLTKPDPASIMDMVMQFDALKKVTFRQSTRLHDGQRQFTYNEENEVRGNVTLPEELMIFLPIFDGQEPDAFRVRVRYDIDDGKLKFAFDIHDRKALEDMAFQRCEDRFMAGLAKPLPLMRMA